MGTVMVPFSFYQNLIFDLDGTLLETITDICIAMNLALRECGYDYQLDVEQTKTLIGDGADKAVERALLIHHEDLQGFSALKAAYMPQYRAHQNDHAKPFDGMKEALEKLKAQGKHLFVVTNKPDALAQVVVKSHFGEDLFDDIIGAFEGKKVKPDPWQIELLAEKYHIDLNKTVFIGDSITDIDTADNAHLPCALALWGYGVYIDSTLARASYLLSKPLELLQ